MLPSLARLPASCVLPAVAITLDPSACRRRAHIVDRPAYSRQVSSRPQQAPPILYTLALPACVRACVCGEMRACVCVFVFKECVSE